jgi:endonuclease YncB( thermonuclease family)
MCRLRLTRCLSNAAKRLAHFVVTYRLTQCISCVPNEGRIMKNLKGRSIVFFLIGILASSWAIANTPIIPSGQDFTCTPTHVWDGDGPIWCREGPRLRLAGIAARELDESCSAGHPCPLAGGIAARDALVGLLGFRTGIGPHGHILIDAHPLLCRSVGSAGGSRTAAWCVSPINGDINCALVQGGWALRWDRYWGQHAC